MPTALHARRAFATYCLKSHALDAHGDPMSARELEVEAARPGRLVVLSGDEMRLAGCTTLYPKWAFVQETNETDSQGDCCGKWHETSVPHATTEVRC